MKTIGTTIAFLLISLVGFGTNPDYAKLDSFFSCLEQNDRFLGSVAVSRAGKIIYSNAIGFADIETKRANTSETKFRIGSTTKTFTAALIMQAVELGKINLDDTIDEYFPEIQNANKITVRQLLNHRSGIKTFTDRSFFSWYTAPISPTNLLDTIVSKGIDFEPNAKHAYSNSNYVLLTFILEKSFNKSYAELLDQHIVKPLKLTNTSYGGIINPAHNEARSYRMRAAWDKETEGDMSIPLGAGGIISTPTDLCHFAEALFGGQLISAESLAQMKPVDDAKYGFALEYAKVDERKGLGHPGNIDAFSSTLAYFEEDNLCIAINCNGSNFGTNDIAVAALREVLGKPYQLPSFEIIELSSEVLEQYLGTYECEELPMDFTISKKENTLSLEATGQASSPLKAEGNHKFSIMQYGVKITFIPSEKRMLFEQQGMEFDCTLKESSRGTTLKNEDVDQKVDQALDQYLGTYAADQLPMDLTISVKDGKLIGQGTGQPSFPLKSEGEHKFSNEEIGLTITFFPKEKKMNFYQGGAFFEMTLVETSESISTALDQYLGTYAADQLPMDLTISVKEGKLIGQGTGQPSFPLKSEGEHKFSNEEIGLTITFFPKEKKMNFYQGGAFFEMNLKE